MKIVGVWWSVMSLRESGVLSFFDTNLYGSTPLIFLFFWITLRSVSYYSFLVIFVDEQEKKIAYPRSFVYTCLQVKEATNEADLTWNLIWLLFVLSIGVTNHYMKLENIFESLHPCFSLKESNWTDNYSNWIWFTKSDLRGWCRKIEHQVVQSIPYKHVVEKAGIKKIGKNSSPLYLLGWDKGLQMCYIIFMACKSVPSMTSSQTPCHKSLT